MPDRLPIIYWLLLVATICVDAAVFSWTNAVPDNEFGFIVFDAVMLSQISVVCIWSGLRSEKSMWTRFSPFFAVLLATLIYGMFSDAHFIGKVGDEWHVRMGSVLMILRVFTRRFF